MHKIYSNIKARRLELNMSQSALAEKTGYSDKGMISRIENGQIDISYSKILDFAKALLTTPQSLMGWDTELPTTLSDEQAVLVKLASNCDSEHYQSAVLLLKDGQQPAEPLE